MQKKRFTLIPEGGMFSKEQLVRLMLPLVAEQFLAILVGVADTVMVTGTGEAAVSAVSLVDSINVLLIQVFAAIGSGGAVVAAQYLGKGDKEMACGSAKQQILASFALSMLVALPAWFLRAPILQGLYGGVEEDIMRQAQIYFLLSGFSYPVFAVYNSGAGLLRAMGDSKTSMNVSIIMNIVNIGGNALFIYVFKWGVAGAGLASCISRAISAVVVTRKLLDKDKPIHLENLHDWKPDWAMIKRIMSVGIPNGLENGLFQIGKLVIARVLSSLPSHMIAANAICNSVAGFIYIPGSSVGLAALTIIGQCIGANDTKQARAYGNRLVILMYAVEIPVSILLMSFPGLFTCFFGSLLPETRACAIEVLRLYGVFTLTFWTPSFGLPCILRAAGDVRASMLVSVTSMLIMRLGMSYLFVYGFNWQLNGIWLAMYCDWIVRSVAFVIRYAKGSWLRHKVV